MNAAAHALVFWLAGALFGLLLGWTLARKAPDPDESGIPFRRADPACEGANATPAGRADVSMRGEASGNSARGAPGRAT